MKEEEDENQSLQLKAGIKQAICSQKYVGCLQIFMVYENDYNI